MYIDTHTHLFASHFDEDLDAAIEYAKECGVDRFILPATDDHAHQKMLDVALKYSDCCYPTIGLHPTAMNQNLRWREHLSRVESMLSCPPAKFVAIGEIGIDLHWSKDYLEEQIEAFKAQIELAKRYDLPIIIHSRDAWDETLTVLEQYEGQIRGVFHSFSGTKEHISRIEGIGGFFYGINGTVTYKNSTLGDALEHIPLSKILLETDAPYLPPEPYRGKRNQSAYIPLIAARVAQIKGVETKELAAITTANARRLFAI